MTRLLRILIMSACLLLPVMAQALVLEAAPRPSLEPVPATDVLPSAKGGGISLDEAIARVRRRGDVERIISAETRREGDREVHVIKYLTKDQRVRTARFDGRRN